jgi:GTP-binding protein
VERAVAITDMNNEEAVRRLQRQLIAMGVEKMLSRSGAEVGDEVRIGDTAFDFEPEDAPAPEDVR